MALSLNAVAVSAFAPAVAPIHTARAASNVRMETIGDLQVSCAAPPTPAVPGRSTLAARVFLVRCCLVSPAASAAGVGSHTALSAAFLPPLPPIPSALVCCFADSPGRSRVLSDARHQAQPCGRLLGSAEARRGGVLGQHQRGDHRVAPPRRDQARPRCYGRLRRLRPAVQRRALAVEPVADDCLRRHLRRGLAARAVGRAAQRRQVADHPWRRLPRVVVGAAVRPCQPCQPCQARGGRAALRNARDRWRSGWVAGSASPRGRGVGDARRGAGGGGCSWRGWRGRCVRPQRRGERARDAPRTAHAGSTARRTT